MRNIKVYTEILTFGKTDSEKDKFYLHKSPIFFEVVNIKKVLVSNKIYFGEKTINTLLVACIMIFKLSHYI